MKRSSIRIAVMIAATVISTAAALPQQHAVQDRASNASLPATVHSSASSPAWLPWSDAVFTEANRDHRFVLLDLEAVWCHWCHVMDVTTYRDPKVLALLHKNYLTVRVDQDSRPDLSNRYEDYGWPATVVFDAAGHEIVKRQGYLTPEEMASMLQAIIDDPSPGPSVQPEKEISFPTSDVLPAVLQTQLEKDYLAGFDAKQGSWGFDQKYLDVDSVELAIDRAAHGDAHAAAMARQTLDAQLQLLDPVWGGFYQYSTDSAWTKPHFEKIMSVQAENLRIYSEAYAQWNDPKYLHAAQAVQQFLATFLTSPDGAFYTSQDADVVEGKHSAEYFALGDKDRRKQGVPRVDTHVYARENGWAIAALAQLYEATGDTKTIDSAIRAANWITQNRALPNGGFRHGAKDVGGPFLGDSIAMVRAYLALYRVTADRKWLTRASATTGFIQNKFRTGADPGFISTVAPTDKAYKPHPQRDENVAVARVANQLFYYTGDSKYEAISKTAMRYLAAEPIATRLPVASVLLTEYEVTHPPLHLTVVGAKSDPAAQSLFSAALKYPSFYKRVEWWDTKEGKLPNPDVQYPSVSRAAAYICTQRTCSPPIFEADVLPAKVNRVLGVQAQETKSDQASAKVQQ
ncbi:MAG TPA: DUF255 domain-containing protein [Candidatus Sulfotelmatobacter sp.]|nr:DUF255 domain-containing protein [Candidatus Sulfotelmatobacter sp.]